MDILCLVEQYVTVGFTWWLWRIVDSEEYTLCLFSDNSRSEKATPGPLTAKLRLIIFFITVHVFITHKSSSTSLHCFKFLDVTSSVQCD